MAADLRATSGLDPLLRLAVGSRTGAPTLGAGGCPTAFAVALSPAAIITFPAPATSNVACGFPALRSPVCFGPWLMGPFRPSRLSAEPKQTAAYSTSLSLSSLRHSAYLPVLVLQITGRVYQFALASHTIRRITNSRAASLRGHYSASSLLPTHPTPSRLPAAFPVSPVIRPTLLRSFLAGREGLPVAQRVLVTMPSITTPPECPIASVCSRWSMLPSP